MNKSASQLHPNIMAAVPMLEGIVKLFHPYVEGAIHDLIEGKVVALYNNISRRNIGDQSPVTELGVDIKDFPDVFEPYYKTNWDGRQLKCTSVTIRDNTGTPIGLVCINFDTSVFQNIGNHIETLLQTQSTSLNPVEQFAENWQQQVSGFMDSYARRYNVALSAMTKDEKAALVCEMYDHALFNYRDAASYIAQQLNVSRTTIYNYLKKGEKQ